MVSIYMVYIYGIRFITASYDLTTDSLKSAPQFVMWHVIRFSLEDLHY